MKFSFIAIFLPLLQCILCAPCFGGKPVPASPVHYILDEPGALDLKSKQTIQSLLMEHEKSSGEQIVVVIINSLEGEDLNDFTSQIFSKWRIGRRGKDNGVLLALFWKERKFRLEVGYGLESVLTDAKAKDILDDFLVPGLREGNVGQAIILTCVEILRILESPLIQSGQAERILRTAGSNAQLQAQSGPPPLLRGWTIWLFLGGILILIVLNTLTSADAHFTRNGWFRSRPWHRYRGPYRDGFWWDGLRRDGGGPWGGHRDGFGGGGGSSGGGGASGSW